MYNNLCNLVIDWYKNERKIVFLSLGIGMLLTIIFTAVSYSDTIQGGIAKEVVRFHVLANSNSDEDQALKLKVRDGILKQFRPLLNSSASFDETKKLLSDNIEHITECAEKIIKENGYDYCIAAKVTKSIFPTKEYGDIVFPAGEYEALRIEIGEAKGNNWWCVMFPPLCYVDITQGKVSNKAKDELKNILSDEEYDIVANYKASGAPSIKVKFKIVELWQKIKNARK